MGLISYLVIGCIVAALACYLEEVDEPNPVGVGLVILFWPIILFIALCVTFTVFLEWVRRKG